MKSKLLFFSLLLVLFSCKDSIEPAPQLVYFEVRYINYAWVKTNEGVLIDSLGNVCSFDAIKTPTWIEPDSMGIISKAAMDKNYSLCDIESQKVSLDSLAYYVAKIPLAANGEISDARHVMADAGIVTFSAYVYDKNKAQYQRILLNQLGDVQIENDAPEAQSIYEWLIRFY